VCHLSICLRTEENQNTCVEAAYCRTFRMRIDFQPAVRQTKEYGSPLTYELLLYCLTELHVKHNNTLITELHVKHNNTLVTDNLYHMSKMQQYVSFCISMSKSLSAVMALVSSSYRLSIWSSVRISSWCFLCTGLHLNIM
jgi:hypothetical protein